MFWQDKEISNRTDTGLEWETKQNKTKLNRGVNVQSIVYARASQSPDSGPDPDREGIQSGPT